MRTRGCEFEMHFLADTRHHDVSNPGLQHVAQRKLNLAGRPAGLALAAMWYLGKKEVTPALIEEIRRKLGSSGRLFMPESFLHLKAQEQSQLYRALAPQLARSSVVREKDVWVCWVLQALFTMPDQLPMRSEPDYVQI